MNGSSSDMCTLSCFRDFDMSVQNTQDVLILPGYIVVLSKIVRGKFPDFGVFVSVCLFTLLYVLSFSLRTHADPNVCLYFLRTRAENICQRHFPFIRSCIPGCSLPLP